LHIIVLIIHGAAPPPTSCCCLLLLAAAAAAAIFLAVQQCGSLFRLKDESSSMSLCDAGIMSAFGPSSGFLKINYPIRDVSK
jgi:hypothetical protein